MSNEEKSHAQLIEEIISRKLRPVYWACGIVVALFTLVSTPLTIEVIKLNRENAEQIKSDEVYRNFLTKGAFYLMQKDEHESDLEALRNPENADLTYMKLNNANMERLELTSRNANQLR